MGKQLHLEIRDRLQITGGNRPPMPWVPNDFLPNPVLRQIKAALETGSLSASNFFSSLWAQEILNSVPSHGSLRSPSTGATWDEIGTNALPGAWNLGGLIVFRDKLWMISGSLGGTRTKKVYSSADGLTWTEVGTDVFPVALAYNVGVVFQGSMWSIAGATAAARVTSVYKSTDGTVWTKVGDIPVALQRHTVLSYDNKLWVIGGEDISAGVRTVYSSPDGVNWTSVGSSPLPRATLGHASVVFDGKMWVIAGNDGSTYRHVFYSTDGATWTEAGSNAIPQARYKHQAVVYDGKMWVFGGDTAGNTPAYSPKVYSSPDGATWTEAGTDALPAARINTFAVVFGGRMWIIGGSTGSATVATVLTSRLAISALNITTDVAAAGGFRQQLTGWYQDDLGAAQAATIMTRSAGFEGSFRPLRAGSITGLLLRSSTARTAGTCTATVYKNGVATAITATLNGTDTTQKITLSAKDAITFAAGDYLDVYLASDASWAPTTADLRAAIEIEN